MGSVKVVVAEDSLLVRAGIQALLAAETDLDVVAVCSSFEELMTDVDLHRPDVVLTDIRMPPTFTDEGVRAATDLQVRYPATGVVILSQFIDPTYLLALIRQGSGRRGYLLKENVAVPGQLISAVRSVADGGSFIDPLVVDSLVRAQGRREQSPLERLTLRERETLAAVAGGRSNAAIAAAFHVSERAVEKHVGSIFAKLDLADDRDTNRRVQAVVLFLSQS